MKSSRRAFSLIASLGLACLLTASHAPAQETALEWNEAGVKALREDRYEEAVRSFERAHELEAEDPVIRLNLARAHAHWGRILFESGRIPEAESAIQTSIGLDRDTGQAEIILAQVHLQLGRRDQAEVGLEQVRKDFPDNIHAIRLLAEIRAVQGRLTEAVELLQAGLEVDGDNADLRKRLAQMEEERKAWEGFLTDSSAHFDYRYDPRNPRIVQAIPELMVDLEDGYQAVAEKLSLAPRDRILVLVYDRERYKGSAPEWSGGLYDGRIRLPIGDYERDRDRIRATLRHEYTHAALHRIGPPIPTWLHEGLAQWVEGRSVDRARRGLLEAGDDWPEQGELSGQWTRWNERGKVTQAYRYALSLCVWLQDTFGPTAYGLLFQHTRSVGFEEGFRRAFGREFKDLEAEHREALRAKL